MDCLMLPNWEREVSYLVLELRLNTCTLVEIIFLTVDDRLNWIGVLPLPLFVMLIPWINWSMSHCLLIQFLIFLAWMLDTKSESASTSSLWSSYPRTYCSSKALCHLLYFSRFAFSYSHSAFWTLGFALKALLIPSTTFAHLCILKNPMYKWCFRQIIPLPLLMSYWRHCQWWLCSMWCMCFHVQLKLCYFRVIFQ